uniref:Nudix hydrolase domain-containing protein n=1 Tax=viral metagenome TaxID=1070528 RepID=A0A6C0EG24_9ZZZZ
MGAGILPITIHNNKLYFLFGKENKFADTPGWADFGGGSEDKETFIKTAVREGTEELTGFLGSESDLERKIKHTGTFDIDFNKYRTHILPMEYDELLPFYYNNNQRFLQKRLDPKIIEKSKIFEKAEIRWFSIDEIKKRKIPFRSYYYNIADLIIKNELAIDKFVRSKLNKSKTYRHKSRKMKKRNTKTRKSGFFSFI